MRASGFVLTTGETSLIRRNSDARRNAVAPGGSRKFTLKSSRGGMTYKNEFSVCWLKN
jgi:hypothetical protein